MNRPAIVRSVEFRLSGKQVPEAKCVYLATRLKQPEASTYLMRKGADDDWTVKVSLPPGECPYLYFVDGVWHNDPNDDGRMASEWGREYSLKVVR